MPEPHVHGLRVYYEDTDFSGFVYHATYLKFLERGRTELLRGLGLIHSRLHGEAGGPAFVVSRMRLEFLKPALMDDWLRVETAVATISGARMDMAQVIWRDGTCLLRAAVEIAMVRAGKPVRLPATLRAAFAGPAFSGPGQDLPRESGQRKP